MQILENGSLFINSLSVGEEADFLCQASNNVNPALSKVIKLIVRSKWAFRLSLFSEYYSLNSICYRNV